MYDGFAIHLIQIKGDVKGAPITLTPPLTRTKDEIYDGFTYTFERRGLKYNNFETPLKRVKDEV